MQKKLITDSGIKCLLDRGFKLDELPKFVRCSRRLSGANISWVSFQLGGKAEDVHGFVRMGGKPLARSRSDKQVA